MALDNQNKRGAILGLLPPPDGAIDLRDRVAFITIMWRDLVQARWEDGIVVKQAERGNELTTAVIPPGDWLLMGKAIDTSGNYSQNAAVVPILVVSTFDVVFSRTAAPRWPGAVDGFVKHDVSGSLLPDSDRLASALTKAELFESFVPYPVPAGTYDFPEIAVGFDTDLRIFGELGGKLGPGVAEGKPAAKLEIDYRLDADVYDGYEAWQIGTVRAAHVKGRVRMDFGQGRARLTRANLILDAQERTEKAVDVAVGSGGISVVFAKRFNLKPAVTVTPEGGLIPDKSNVTVTGFDLVLRDSAGDPQAGVADWTAIGV